jgi:putative ABC transport system permease protein
VSRVRPPLPDRDDVPRLLRALGRLAPPAFRARYGDAVLAFQGERLREAARGGEPRLRVWGRILADLAVTLALEWTRELSARGRRGAPAPTAHDVAIARTQAREDQMSVIGQEIVHAARSLRNNLGFTAAAVVTLALGLSSTTAIFSVVDSVLLRPLPFPEPERIVVPQSQNVATGERWTITYADFMDWRDHRVFAHVAAYQDTQMDLTGPDEPVRVQAAAVSPQFFGALGTPAAMGRLLAPSDYPVDAPRAVVISDRLWRTQFGGRKDVVGLMVEVNAIKRPIVGVLPPGVRWPLEADLWVPQRFTTEQDPDLQRRDNYVFTGIARLKPGATREGTRATMATLAARAASAHPVIRKDVTTVPTPVLEWLLGPTTPRALWLLLGAVALLLLIGCVNVANLQLARAAARQRELAVRTALGANRSRLVRQTLVESAVLGLTGGALGMLLARWMVRLIVVAAPADVPRIEAATLNLPAVGFALAVSIAVALLFGLAPAAHAARSDPHLALGDGGARTSAGRAGARTRRALVVVELALSVVLLVGSGLALRSIARLRAVRPGFDPSSVLTASISLPGIRYGTDALAAAFMYQLRDRLAVAPGVEAAGIASASPLGAGGFYLGRSMVAQGRDPVPANEVSVSWTVTTPGYFAALGLPFRRGRDFTARDDSTAPPVMIVNETFARTMFGTADAIGRRAMSSRDEKVYREIVGVVGDVRFAGARDSAPALVWVPYAQRNGWSQGIVTIRTRGAPQGAVAVLRRELRALDGGIAVANVLTMDQAMARSVAGDRLVAILLGAFAALALLLAAVGVFGVLSYTVTQRSRELGIRVALGARRPDMMTLVLRETLPMVGAGVLIGLTAALALARVMRAMLYEVQPTDPATLAGVAALLAAVGLLAALVPARRAARVDPVVTLRNE